VYLEQLYSFGDVGRDPRGRVITVAYFALISADRPLRAGTDAAEAEWWAMDELPTLAFDHARILNYALERLRNKLEYTTVGFQLLPEKFTLTELQEVYEAILRKKSRQAQLSAKTISAENPEASAGVSKRWTTTSAALPVCRCSI